MRTYRKHITCTLATVLWRHCLWRSVLPLQCLVTDVLLFRAFASAGTYLTNRCLAMGLHVTIRHNMISIWIYLLQQMLILSWHFTFQSTHTFIDLGIKVINISAILYFKQVYDWPRRWTMNNILFESRICKILDITDYTLSISRKRNSSLAVPVRRGWHNRVLSSHTYLISLWNASSG